MVANRHFTSTEKEQNSPPRFPTFLLLIAITAILGMFYKGVDFIKVNKEGNLELSEERQQRLERELEELENAEQYVLRVVVPGFYPCYNCKGKEQIYLYTGEIWRYGVTTKGQTGRYPDGLPEDGLIYEIQFKGTLQECLAEEKKKIFNYPLLPENTKRKSPIIRPPGNKIDR